MEYAIVQTGGKQYRVQPGDVIDVEKLEAEAGSTVELAPVLLLSRDGQVTTGTPDVEGARVVAEVQAHGRGDKIIVFKFKPKVRYRRKQGHRQAYTRLAIKEIAVGEAKPEASSRRRPRKQAEKQEGEK